MSESGNIEKPMTEPTPPAKFEKGDRVRMTDVTLRDKKKIKMGPRILHSVGWPNDFEVEDVFEREKEGLCISLTSCCFWMRNSKGKFICGGHPVSCFEKVVDPASKREESEPLREGDRRASITVPYLGELMGYEYRTDEHGHKKAIFRVGGQKCVAEGGLADLINSVIEKHGIG